MPGEQLVLHDEIQQWLEAASDKAKRHARATELCTKGASKLDDYHALQEKIAIADSHVDNVRQRFHDWQSVEDKRELFDAEDDARALRRTLAETPGIKKFCLGEIWDGYSKDSN